MSSIAHVISHVKKYKGKHLYLYIFSAHSFFISIFAGIIAYMTPLVFLRHGLSQTHMGLILGASAVFGAFFDIVLSKILPSTHYRRMYMLLTAVCFILVFLLWNASSLPMFFAVAAASGLFYDLLHMGNYDFVSRETAPQEHASSFGVLNVFRALGFICAPLALAFTFTQPTSSTPFWNALLWAGLSMAAFATLIFVKNSREKENLEEAPSHIKKMNFLLELHMWRKVGKQLLPVLMFTLLLGMNGSFFWTLAPILTEQLRHLHFSGALFIPLSMLPTLLVGWFVGPMTRRFGKKNTAYWFYIASAIVMIGLAFAHNAQTIVTLAFISSLFGAFSFPAISGAYADYLSEAPQVEKEIESVCDFFSNIGCVFGPILGGILADVVGIQNAFALFSLLSITIVLWIIKASPKEITVRS